MASPDPEPALTRRQQLALVAMLSARAVAGAAGQSGVSERSIYRWLSLEATIAPSFTWLADG